MWFIALDKTESMLYFKSTISLFRYRNHQPHAYTFSKDIPSPYPTEPHHVSSVTMFASFAL